MQTKQHPADFLVNSIFFFLLFLVPFAAIRLYFYFNYYFPNNEFAFLDLLKMLLVGLRFDLCVIGFFIIPSYFLYWISYLEKLKPACVLVNQAYKVAILLTVFTVLYFNLPFMSVNLPFDLPFWMRWEDYQSILFINCSSCYWDYEYVSRIYPIQILTGLVFLLVLFGSFSRWNFFTRDFSLRREALFIVAIGLMARGNLGQQHLRYEDSIWHKSVLINELSNNPLWLLDKLKSDRRLEND